MGLKRISQGLIFLAAAAAVVFAPTPSPARAQSTDVLLLFDTSGSMEGALDSAVTEVQSITDRVRGELGDVAFGVAEVRDYPISTFENGGSGDQPYEVVQPVTNDRAAVVRALNGLFATGGGDGPEAYGRALRDADLGAGLGWRPGARRLVVMVADNVPHDDDLNWGIPASAQAFSSPFDTIRDPGSDAIVGTGDDIDWQALLGQLNEHGLPLMFVLFEGDEDLLPYWQTWAGWTGGAAASAESANLADLVVELARRGATAALPQCPPGQTRDEARRCRPYSEWLGYSFKNDNLPAWARAAKLSRDDVLTKDLVQRTFSDIRFPSWWAFWKDDPRAAWWKEMEAGTCYGMALSGGRFSTALQPFLSAGDGRSAITWGVSRTPLLPGPTAGTDATYKRELLQTLATDFVSQFSTEVQASIFDQKRYFTSRSRVGQSAAALRSQLESVMTGGHGNVGSSSLASERPTGLATVEFWDQGAGHAVVAYNIRDSGGGAFQIDTWDNNRPGMIDSISVRADGSWAYGPLGWDGGADRIVVQPQYPARGLHLEDGGTTSSGREVTIADVPSGATGLHAMAETDKGANTDVTIQPVPVASPSQESGNTVVTDGSQLRLTLTDQYAGATARGHGTILTAAGLTGASRAAATIDYDVDDGTLATQAPDAGTLAVTRDKLHVASTGATGLGLARSGTATVKAAKGGRVSLVISSAAKASLASATLTLRMPRNGSAKIAGRQTEKLIRHGGQVALVVRGGKHRETVRTEAHTVAHSYRLRALVKLKRHRAAVTLSALRRLPRGSEGTVRWTVTKGKRVLRRRSTEIEHPRTDHALAKLRLPKGIHGAVVKAVVHVVVKSPGPAELIAAATQRLR